MDPDQLLNTVLYHVRYGSAGGVTRTHLLRLVHGDPAVPSSVKDDDVLAALTVAVERGWLAYSETRFDTRDGHPCIEYAFPATYNSDFVADIREED